MFCRAISRHLAPITGYVMALSNFIQTSSDSFFRLIQTQGDLMRTKLAAMVLAAGLLPAVVPVWAHHSFAAEFDIKKPLNLQGTFTEMEWINPHAWIHIDVKGPDGKVTNWMVEAG